MGGNASKGVCGSLDGGSEVIAGSTIAGKAYIRWDGDMSKEDLRLRVVLTGKEKTCVQYTERRGHGKNAKTVTRRAYASHPFLEERLSLGNLNNERGGRVGVS